jgi:hypothetical protein
MKTSILPKTSSANSLLFEEDYWSSIYGNGSFVDGNFNAKEHAKYLYSLFDLMNISVESLIDFGFGKGFLFREFTQKFKPTQNLVGIEPSNLMFQEILKQNWYTDFPVSLFHSTIEEVTLPKGLLPFDLGICNSVVQYIGTDLMIVFDKLSDYTKYLYFSVPTKSDYIRMKADLNFTDPYAYSRSKAMYQKYISPFFTVVSHNLLQSKKHPREDYSFMDEFYRF